MRLKTLAALAAYFTLSSAAANTRFEQMETFREIQTLVHVENERNAALELARQLLTTLEQNDELYGQVSNLLEAEEKRDRFPLEKAVKFATGKKEEIYCKDQGLVHLIAFHNDGTESTVKLVQSNREMGGTYNHLKSGDWVYEFDTGYRDPVLSQSWVEKSSEQSYIIRELRENDEGQIDKGRWEAEWSEDGRGRSFSTSGKSLEPLPWYLGNDYHLWGSWDLGFKLEFKVGYRDEMRSKVSSTKKRFFLKTDRLVSEYLENFGFHDSKKIFYSFEDCYKVESNIQFGRFQVGKDDAKKSQETENAIKSEEQSTKMNVDGSTDSGESADSVDSINQAEGNDGLETSTKARKLNNTIFIPK